ncbi:hypothetical protein SBRCBS47491_009923 [Sporothrix bragantina]|uniref:Uncharacterized protein n=1 Tax=Sporothrix bragantina TaxID=671064 RepID=A0ABP0D1K9_9PEZI
MAPFPLQQWTTKPTRSSTPRTPPEATGFLDTTSVAYSQRLADEDDPPGTKSAVPVKNIFFTHRVSLDVIETSVTKPDGYTAPWGRRGPRVSMPILRDARTGETPAAAYKIAVLIATFMDPTLMPFNQYLHSLVTEHVKEQNDSIYVSWFEDNHIPVLLPCTYNVELESPVSTANSAVYQALTVSI